MERAMAQGTFDILHPGHLHYLRESASLGDELYVVIARDSRQTAKKDLFMDEESRRTVVDALEIVDAAVLGAEGSIFDSVDRIAPDIITIGYDQDFEPPILEATLQEHGYSGVEVVQIGPYDDGGIQSSSDVKDRIARRRGAEVFEYTQEK